jgi:hypothetical protein
MRPKLPRNHEVVLDFGPAASSITDVELAWIPTGSEDDEAALTTRWHFAEGSAPSRLRTTVHLPDGAFTADVSVARSGTNETTRWSRRVNLEEMPFWKGSASPDEPVVLPVRLALR